MTCHARNNSMWSLYTTSTNPTNTGAHSSLHILMTISLHWVTTMTHDSKNKPWVFCKRNARKSWLESAFTLCSLPADPLFRSSWLSHLKTHVLCEALTPLEASIVRPLQIGWHISGAMLVGAVEIKLGKPCHYSAIEVPVSHHCKKHRSPDTRAHLHRPLRRPHLLSSVS